jgi:hypothetical protein
MKLSELTGTESEDDPKQEPLPRGVGGEIRGGEEGQERRRLTPPPAPLLAGSCRIDAHGRRPVSKIVYLDCEAHPSTP